jgi:hypothetical protein
MSHDKIRKKVLAITDGGTERLSRGCSPWIPVLSLGEALLNVGEVGFPLCPTMFIVFLFWGTALSAAVPLRTKISFRRIRTRYRQYY